MDHHSGGRFGKIQYGCILPESILTFELLCLGQVLKKRVFPPQNEPHRAKLLFRGLETFLQKKTNNISLRGKLHLKPLKFEHIL